MIRYDMVRVCVRMDLCVDKWVVNLAQSAQEPGSVCVCGCGARVYAYVKRVCVRMHVAFVCERV